MTDSMSIREYWRRAMDLAPCKSKEVSRAVGGPMVRPLPPVDLLVGRLRPALSDLCKQVSISEALRQYGEALVQAASFYPLGDQIRLIGSALDADQIGWLQDLDGPGRFGIMIGPESVAHRQIGDGELAGVLRRIFKHISDQGFISGVLATFYRPALLQVQQSFGGIKEYYGKSFPTILIEATKDLAVEARKTVIREATAQITDSERRNDLLRSISAQIHESEGMEINFIGDIVFRLAPPKSDRIVLSRGEELMVSLNEMVGINFFDTKDLYAKLATLGQDACIVIPSRHMPSWIINHFDMASQGYKNASGKADDFLTDLRRYCDYVGFTTFLGVINKGGEVSPVSGLQMCDIEIGAASEVAKSREPYMQSDDPSVIFGPFYDRMKGRSVLITMMDEGCVISDEFAAATIAHKVGHLKFIDMVRRKGLPLHAFSEDAREFFSYVYMANFVLGQETTLLPHGMDESSIGFYGKILKCALLHRNRMSGQERQSFEITKIETPISKTAYFIDVQI